MKPKVSREIVILSGLLILFVVLGLIFAPSTQAPQDSHGIGAEGIWDPSVTSDRYHGSRGIFELTKKLGYLPNVEKTDWSHLPNKSQLLISISPQPEVLGMLAGKKTESQVNQTKLTADDAYGVMSWLKSGRTLLLMTSVLPQQGSVPDTTSDGSEDDGDSQPGFGDVIGASVQATQEGNQTNFVPLQPSPLTLGVDSIHLSDGGSRAYRTRRDYVSLFATVIPMQDGRAKVEPAVMVFKVGKGRVILIADDFFASNENLSNADNAEFIANIISSSTQLGSTVLFDEYHHGDIEAASDDLWGAMSTPLRAITWQIALICLLVVGMLAPRFGPIKALVTTGGRASGEYLSSLAGLYRRARATAPALEIIYKQFLRDLCDRLALPQDVPLEKLADVAARHSKINPETLKRLILACENALDTKTLSSADLVTLTKQMEQVKRQLM